MEGATPACLHYLYPALLTYMGVTLLPLQWPAARDYYTGGEPGSGGSPTASMRRAKSSPAARQAHSSDSPVRSGTLTA